MKRNNRASRIERETVEVDDVLGGEDFSVARVEPGEDVEALRRTRVELGLLPEEPFPKIEIVACHAVPRDVVILVNPQTGERMFIKVGPS